MTGVPPAEGKRLPWSDIPAPLRADVERLLGACVIEAVSQSGGFSPGVAARLRLDNGGRAFVRAVGAVNPESPRIHRSEARIAAALPACAPAPRLLGFLDADGWVILILEDIEGRMPAQPWPQPELDQVLSAMTELAAALTPAPIEAPAAALSYDDLGRSWQLFAGEQATGEPARTGDLARLAPWAARNLDRCAALETSWTEAVTGDCLAHGDIRADNVLLTADRVVFVELALGLSRAAVVRPGGDAAERGDARRARAGDGAGRAPAGPGGRSGRGHCRRGGARGVLHLEMRSAGPAGSAHLARLPARAGTSRAGLAQAAHRLELELDAHILDAHITVSQAWRGVRPGSLVRMRAGRR